MNAKRESICPRCTSTIYAGETIEKSDYGYSHVGCTPSLAAMQKLAERDRVVSYLREHAQDGGLDAYALSLLTQWDEKHWLSEKQVASILNKRINKTESADVRTPALPDKEAVPAGRYALQLEVHGRTYDYLVRVYRGSRNPDYVKVYEYDSGEALSMKAAAQTMEKIVRDGKEVCAERFGQLRGKCWKCDRRLEQKLSVELNMGPECMKHIYTREVRLARMAAARQAVRLRGEDPNAPAYENTQLGMEVAA